MSKYVYMFGGGMADGDGTMKDTLGGKGSGLAEMSRAGVPVPPGFTIITDFKKIVKKVTKKEFPQDTHEQLLLSRNAVFMSWWAPKASYYRKMEKISDRLGTACNIQTMVFGNMGDTSCTGVGFTRDPG